MKVYLITNKNNIDSNGFRWDKNVTHIASAKEKINNSGFIHTYISPYHAKIFAFNFNTNINYLWECEAKIKKFDGIKVECTELTTIKKINIPEISLQQKIYFGYLCANDMMHIFKQNYFDDKKPQYILKLIKKYLDGEKIDQNKFLSNLNNLKNIHMNTQINIIIDIINIIIYIAYATIYNIYAIEEIDNSIENFQYVSVHTNTVIRIIFRLIYDNNNDINKQIVNKNIKKIIKFEEK